MRHNALDTIFLLPVLGLLTTANGNKIHKRQSSTSPALTPPSAPSPPRVTPPTILLSDHIFSLCKPNIAVYLWGTDKQKATVGLAAALSIEEVALTLEQSAYPCEKQEWLWYFCVDKKGVSDQASKEAIETERRCLCSAKSEAKGFGEWFAIEQACLSCEASNGYGESSKYIEWHREASNWAEPRFCNATTPELNYFNLITGQEIEAVNGEKPDRPEGEVKPDGEMTMKSPTVVNEGGKGSDDGEGGKGSDDGEGGEEDDTNMAASGEAAQNEEAAGGGNKLRVGGDIIAVAAVVGAALIL